MSQRLSQRYPQFELVRADWKTRGARLDELLAIIALVHEGRDVEYHGRHYDLPRCRMRPVPSRRVPVMAGGHSDAALQRAARSDGWLGVDHAFDDLVPLVRKLLDLRRREDRGAERFGAFAILKHFPDLDTLRRRADLGVTMTQDYAWFCKGEPFSSLDHKRETMQRFAEQTIHAFERARA